MAYFTTEASAKPAAASSVAQAYVDTLYNYGDFFSTNNGQLGPDNALQGKTVGIVGAGAAGLMAGYLLTLQGAKVTVYEATDRTGGRVQSYHPISGDPAIFEMGAMRVPPSERTFKYFATKFGLTPSGQFPDPGKVETNIIFQNQFYSWNAGGSAPSIFDNVSKGWNALATQWMDDIGSNLFDHSNFPNAKVNWQMLINPPLVANNQAPEQGYSHISFYQGLVQAFVENYKKYKCNRWTEQDFALFGALGLGSGGFGPLYQVNFAEIARLVVNGLESDQQFYPDGLETLVDGFKQTVERVGSVERNCKVIAVSGKGTSNGPAQITYSPRGTTPVTKNFDAVVVATTTRSMQVDMALTDPIHTTSVLSDEEATAIRKMHLMNSSKLFVLTKTKFWKNSNLPANIQTDGLVRGLYCLDYPNSQYGVVLISYTWGDDSTKYISIKDPTERLKLLVDSLRSNTNLTPFVQALEQNLLAQYTTMVDWQDQPHYYGAFKLNYPGQDSRNEELYFQFKNPKNRGVYLAGDSVGWCGGWIEGALQTGVNAASGVVNQLAGSNGLYANSPYNQSSGLYSYTP